MSNYLEIRPPKPEEYSEVVTVINSEKDTWSQAFSQTEMDELGIGQETTEDLVVGAQSRDYLVATLNDTIVGFASWRMKTHDIAWISMLQVLTSHQGEGIGTQLMQAIERQAREKGARIIGLETQKKATWAVSFYSKRDYAVLTNDLAKRLQIESMLSRPIASDLPYVILVKKLLPDE